MVGLIREAVAATLARCWVLLVRSLTSDVRDVAVNPLQRPERQLGILTRFRLGSSTTTVATSDAPDELRSALEDARARFVLGVLFHPLEQVAHSGAVLVAHISERGFINAEHFLAVYNRPSVFLQHDDSTDAKPFGDA